MTVTNNDAPEAMLEGLLQSVVCTDVIGWRMEARKLVLVFTDQLYHVAGDARVSYSDNLCMLNSLLCNIYIYQFTTFCIAVILICQMP